MKNIIYIEFTNFKDYPLGGHLSFAIHLTTAMQGQIDLAGMRTEDYLPVGEWSRVKINGFEYDFFNLKNKKKSFKKPLIPSRIPDYFLMKKYVKDVLAHKDYDIIIIQVPEILMALPKEALYKVCLIMPGCGNPIQISRYQWARKFAGFYDNLFFSYAKHVKIILPAADSKSIAEFIARSKSTVSMEKIVQFPTRYDAEIFLVMPKSDARKLLGVSEDELMLVTTGRLNWFKGWKFMIDALKIFREKHANVRLYFLGKGEDEQCIRDYVTEKNMQDSVILAGVYPLTVVSQYLNAADMFIMGSYAEGWSTSLVEAVACANPCVVTEFSSAHDMVKDGKNGFVETERNEQRFVELMEKALQLDKVVIEQYAKDAYSMSVQTMRDQLNNILHFE